MTKFFLKLLNGFSDIVQFKISMAKRKEIIALQTFANQTQQNAVSAKRLGVLSD